LSETVQPPFLLFLAKGVENAGFETDDVLAAILPLMKQVVATHELGQMAPLKGIDDLLIGDEGQLQFDPGKALSPRNNIRRVERLQEEASKAIAVVGEVQRETDLDRATLTVNDLQVGRDAGGEITKPVYVPGYSSWEHGVGHHDELTDIFSLGMLLASVACGADFTNAEELEAFTLNRTNLFALNPRLNPVVASVIVQMTELNRHKRSPDLAQVISRLENYREQTTDLNLSRIPGFESSGISGKRRLIQAHLRDRLFEISRRNRLIYFKPGMQTLNLTEASVPLMLDYRNIKLEQLFVWHPKLAATVAEGSPMPLGRYLRFEDAPYIPGVLDKIISDARRDRVEFGFAQLRLVLCFLRWNNLKEAKNERIHSPLLLLPVELVKKKGVRDSYVMDPTSTEAEVNPVLRHHLKELYNLDLPECVDLKETSLDQFYEYLKAQIQASEPGVVLNKIDRPQIELIREKAKQRLDQYQRRLKVQSRRTRQSPRPTYSYDRENYQPLGLQLFLQKVRPAPMPMRDVAGAPPQPRVPHLVEPAATEEPGKVLETERDMFALKDGTNNNPYSWDFDLCSLTLGNFNYRKMTLVRDYAKLIETDTASSAFDTVFSLIPKRPEDTALAALPITDQHLIVSCDGTQASAVARARTGQSYIIQGPPGTGKSQTITNLVADYVARGKRVLFVCEKRAAIDVVFHRLRQQGLDELCCLIHDSQTDKKAFILNLKQTYEKFLSSADLDPDADRLRTATLRAMEQELASLTRFSQTMHAAHQATGIPLRSLLHRLVQLSGHAPELPPEVEDILPEYPAWLAHGELVNRLERALADLGEDLHFARHPLRWLAKDVVEADRPVETLSARLDAAEDLLDSIENAMEAAGLPAEMWDSLDSVDAMLQFAVRARPLAERNLLGILSKGTAAGEFKKLAGRIDVASQALATAQEKTGGWHSPLSPEDTRNALAQAKAFENSFLRFVQPAYWSLRKILRTRYDLSRHTVAPAWGQLLQELSDMHSAQATLDEARKQANAAWQTEDAIAFRGEVEALQKDEVAGHASVKALLRQVTATVGAPVIETLAEIHEPYLRFKSTLNSLLCDYQQLTLSGLSSLLAQLRKQTSLLIELAPILAELVELPDRVTHALRTADLPLNEFEAAIGHRSVMQVYRQDRTITRFDGRVLARHMVQLEKNFQQLLDLNARCIRAAVRQKFLDHVHVSSLPAAQLDAEQKAFKKTYVAGRRDVEHEFGKSMRFRSIRDLAAGNTGQVIQDLKPIWLMSPLSVSDTLPLDPDLFDVVIFDEASQIPLEEAIPALYRSHQVIIVGDEMQLPPTSFFSSTRGEEESVLVEEEGERIEIDLDSDSFLTQSAQNVPSTLLAWHYRSRYESLISFSNAAFYSGNLYTIPDRKSAAAAETEAEISVSTVEQADANVDALLARSISFHYMQNGVYEDRVNPTEAAYIARLVRGLLQGDSKLSIGVVAFSEAQQGEIEAALDNLAEEDPEFSARLESEFSREEDDVFCGLFVKNLENVQGDERDIIIMSVCYARNPQGKMLMNFGPINQRGGEKRLNVIFSRAKHHMAIVSSIRHGQITNDFNDGARSLKSFLQYAEAVSRGDEAMARVVLEGLNPLSRKALAPLSREDAVATSLVSALRSRGYVADLNVGQSRFRCDVAVRKEADALYQLGILIDTDSQYANPNLLDRYLMQPSILGAFGWQVTMVLTKDWYHDPESVLSRIERLLTGQPSSDDATPVPVDEEAAGGDAQDVQVADAPRAANTAPGLPSEGTSGGVTYQSPAPHHTEANAQAPAQASTVRRLELVSDTSKKFWEVSTSGPSITVRFGRIGTAGQTQTRSMESEAKATQEADRLLAEKLKKGYTQVS